MSDFREGGDTPPTDNTFNIVDVYAEPDSKDDITMANYLFDLEGNERELTVEVPYKIYHKYKDSNEFIAEYLNDEFNFMLYEDKEVIGSLKSFIVIRTDQPLNKQK